MGRTRQLRLLPTVKKELTLWKCLDAGLYFLLGKALVLADFQKKIDGDLTSAVRWGYSLDVPPLSLLTSANLEYDPPRGQ